ncbi:NADPH-dependent FMN reductase [Amycolatopsis coloradensis]|uniref:NADPH-dependent FMN reductase n=1 Tax=Amycolatopsis coloradensis TaxID=76021 RepID=A0A1R0KGU1_9PSEU|nr:NAD(P)H-dependent oxidoreductase [Amycolatopsis coloradensis]OLZ44881.1 NADPH-dependent FMN reductase [Amycolatopsis coloradensis]
MTTETPYNLAVVIGSVREGRFAPVVANWFLDRAKQREDVNLSVIDLAESPDGLSSGVAAADAVVVIVPEYNHSYPGPFKTALDNTGSEWHGKPVAFVSYGGISGGLRAVEHLRPVFAELHAMTIRETVSFPYAWNNFGSDGEHLDADGADLAATTQLNQLGWWAHALRDARQARPYSA